MIDQLKPTLHTTLSLHHSRYEYKRGQYQGDAPADASRRWKSHFRVQKLTDGSYAVLFHNTRIIRAYPDGTVMLDSAGWDGSPTTRDAFGYYGYWLRSHRVGSYAQTVLCPSRRYLGPRVRFYDGMTLGPDWRLTSPSRPLMRRVADRATRKEWREDADVMAFRAALPVLHAAVGAMEPRATAQLRYSLDFRRISSACDRHENWPAIVARYYRDTPAETWAAFSADAVKDMTVDEEVL